jgi:hypothetical protein
MKKTLAMAVVWTIVALGAPAWTLADDPGKSQGQQSQGGKKKSDKGKVPGAGPMGEMEKGGAGPSGPQGNSPTKAPGFEGAASKKGGAPATPGQ